MLLYVTGVNDIGLRQVRGVLLDAFSRDIVVNLVEDFTSMGDMDLYSILQDNLALDLVLSTYVTINLLSLFAVAKIKLNLLSVC